MSMPQWRKKPHIRVSFRTYVRDNLSKLFKDGPIDEVLEIIKQQGISISRNIAYSLLQLCTGKRGLPSVREIQFLLVHNGLDSVEILGNHVIRLFSAAKSLAELNQAFNTISMPSIYTWGSTFLANANLGHGDSALELYNKMLLTIEKCDRVVFLALLKSCTTLYQLRYIHEQVIKSELELDVVWGSSLVDMYGKCGGLEESQKLFDELPNRNVVSWGAIIAGYANYGDGLLAVDSFNRMKKEGISADKVTFLSMLKACGRMKALEQGRLVHDQILANGFETDLTLGSAVVDMYAKCGCLTESQEVFDCLLNHDVVAWGAIIAGYAHHNEGLIVLQLVEKMQAQGISLNGVIFSSIIKACGTLLDVQQGRLIHEKILSQGTELDEHIVSGIVDMYAKCGNLGEAHEAFEKLPVPSVASWNALIAGYARHGEFLLALEYFERMQRKGIRPNEVTFLCVLVACNSAGLVDKGRWCFEVMKEHYGIEPNIDHYNCVVDLLGRAGRLGEAMDILKACQCPNFLSWSSLLNASQMHGDLELAKRCFEELVHTEPLCGSGYVLMSNIYASSMLKA